MRVAMCSTEWVRRGDGMVGGGTLHVRFELPARYLRLAGHEVVIGGLYRKEGIHELLIRPWDSEAANFTDHCEGDFDLVVLQRYMNDRLAEDVKWARAMGQRIINDVDDWFDGLPRSNRAYYITHPNPIVRAEGKLRARLRRRPKPEEVSEHLRGCQECNEASAVNRDHYRKVIAAGDALTVSTQFLADAYASLGIPVYLLRNAPDVSRFEFQEPTDTEQPSLGWYGGLGFRSTGDFEILKRVLPKWLRGHPERRFMWGGASGPDEARRAMQVFGLHGLGSRLTVRKMVTIDRLPDLVKGFDVGLVPLEDNDFNRAKSALKGVELGAAGIPYVASPLPEYRWFDGGSLATSTQEWLDALERLADPVTRRIEAERARARAEEVSIDRHWPDWEAAYTEICAGTFVGAIG